LRFPCQNFVSPSMLHIPFISHSWLNHPNSIRWKVHVKFLNVWAAAIWNQEHPWIVNGLN
jgi:hypothetical protein